MNTKKSFPVSVLALLIVLGLAVLAGCGQFLTGSGNPVTNEYEFTDFDELSIESAFEGTVTRGDDYRVSVTVDDNLVERLQVEQTGGRVRIGFDEPVNAGNATLRYEITLPALVDLRASGASRATLSGFNTSEALTLEASGASRIEGDITAGDVDFDASGASNIAVVGQGGTLRAHASGASTIDLSQFPTANGDVEASGASTIIVNTGGELNAEASGASNIEYMGDPTLGTLKEGGGSNIGPR